MAASGNEWLVSDSEDEDTFPLGGRDFRDSEPNHSFMDNLKSTEGKQLARLNDTDSRLLSRSSSYTSAKFCNLPMQQAGPFSLHRRVKWTPPLITSRAYHLRLARQTSCPKTKATTASAGTSFSHISDPSIPTMASDESIQPATATSFGCPEAAAYSSLGIADRAKMRSRTSQTAKKSVYRRAEDVEPTKRQKQQDKPPPKPKARPKPTLKVKAVAALPPDSQSSGIVIPDLKAPSAKSASSQPPASTMPTIPPCTPLQPHEPTPPSSPIITTRKRKRVRSFIPDDEDDDMDVGGEIPRSLSPPIPEPFFAPSSSSIPIPDSGVQIPLTRGGGRKKQVSSSTKKAGQSKTQRKGKKGKGKKLDDDDFSDEVAEESARITHEPSIPATFDESEFAEERASGVAVTSKAMKKAPAKPSAKKKGKAKATASDDEADEAIPPQRHP
ncbi:hypothetical protein BU15DRAFT_59826 [Melanogaster broomeanus]|nr:hypothetical protein BU15DRAFT_59826 [Melanogaster broomeanus]